MTVIKSLPVKHADIPESLLSRLPIRDSSVVSSLTGSSGKVSGGRRKSGVNEMTVDNIKNHLTDCGILTQQILTIEELLKDSIYSKQSGQVDIINTEQD